MLPEIVTTVSAGWLNMPDLAAGNLFGVGMSNLRTRGLIDLLYRQKRVWQQVGVGFGSLTLILLYVLGLWL